MSRVEIYFNLHKRVFSVRCCGRVLSHASCILIREPRFMVQEAGRQRVLRERRKNVHAFVTCSPGHFQIMKQDAFLAPLGEGAEYVRYNPYESDCFRLVHRVGPRVSISEPIHEAPWAWMWVRDGIPSIQIPA